MAIDPLILVVVGASIPPTITGVASIVVSLISHRQTDAKVDEIKRATDGMKDALVNATRDQALMEGHAEGVAQEKELSMIKAEARAEGVSNGAAQAHKP